MGQFFLILVLCVVTSLIFILRRGSGTQTQGNKKINNKIHFIIDFFIRVASLRRVKNKKTTQAILCDRSQFICFIYGGVVTVLFISIYCLEYDASLSFIELSMCTPVIFKANKMAKMKGDLYKETVSLDLDLWGVNLRSNIGSGRLTKIERNMIKLAPFQYSVIVGLLLSFPAGSG